MATRYLGPEKAAAYVEFSKREHGANVAVTIEPKHWVSADLGAWS